MHRLGNPAQPAIVAALLLFILSLPRAVYAAFVDWERENCLREGGVATIQCLEPLFANVVRSLVALAGIALFIMLLVGGFTFLVSGGDQKKIEQARNTLTYAVFGLVVIVAAFLILKTIQVFTGVSEITKFEIPAAQ